MTGAISLRDALFFFEMAQCAIARSSAAPIAPCAKARRARRFHEDETMTKQISCGPFTPAHPGRRENFTRLPGVGDSGRAAESRPGAHAGVSREFPKNSINIGKFLKIKCRMKYCNIFNNNDMNNYMSAGRSEKALVNFFARRICPHIR